MLGKRRERQFNYFEEPFTSQVNIFEQFFDTFSGGVERLNKNNFRFVLSSL